MWIFVQPVWLLLLIPLTAAWFVWPLPGRLLRLFRALTFLLVVLALARFAVKLPDRAGTVIVVADRSHSMPKTADAAEAEMIGLLQKSMKPRDLLGVVAFGRQAVVEQSPQAGPFGGFTGQAGPDHSDLNAGLNAALNLIPPDGSGRILVISDGKWTGENPAVAAARAAARSIAVDYRLLARPPASDVAIQSFAAPQSVLPDDGYILSAWIRSPVEQQIGYQLRRGSTVIASGSKAVAAGLTRLMFRDRAGQTGVYDYTLSIQGPQDDPVPENNDARALVTVQGAKPILLVSAAGGNSGLAKLLRAGGVGVVAATPGQCRWSLEDLAQYSGVLLENVPANQIGRNAMQMLASWVPQTGSGLMLTGGQKSYGPGGYYKSPLDPLLPVSMELRTEQRKFSLAIVVALDRSGSMSAPAGPGRTKMDLADLGTAQVLDLLSPMDEFGVFAVDTRAHLIVPLDTAERDQSMRGAILSIASQGGGIYIYEALEAAAGMIAQAKAQTRHIILFADASDSRQHPGDYRDIVEKCREAGVTISVVGLGTEHDCDADLLKDIAQRGAGACYFSDNPDEIPQLFTQDTFAVARSTFVDKPSPFQFTAAYLSLGAPLAGAPPSLGGYNLCYVRPEANLAAVTGDENGAPVVAAWNAGAGRVLCFTGEADGKYSGPLAQWNQVGEFYATLARWTAGTRQALPPDELLTQQVRDGVCFVQLHLDPDRPSDPFSAPPRVNVLHGLPGVAPASATVPLRWKTADLLEAAVPITGRETMLNTVQIPGQSAVTLPPVCLPYSPEFAPEQPGRGAATLAGLAAATGGRERVEIPRMWSDLQARPRYVELAPWLLVLAVILFLLEILERRTGWISRLAAPNEARVVAAPVEGPDAIAAAKPGFWRRFNRGRVRKKAARPAAPVRTETESAPAAPMPVSRTAAGGTDSNLDALRQARERASRRTGRKS